MRTVTRVYQLMMRKLSLVEISLSYCFTDLIGCVIHASYRPVNPPLVTDKQECDVFYENLLLAPKTRSTAEANYTYYCLF